MTRPQTNATDSRNAMVAGLLASGISVNGLQPSHNPQVALRMFTAATSLDPQMCDAWLARLLAGDQSIEVLTGAWQSVKTFGWEIRRLGLTELEFRPEVSDGMFLKLAVTSVESLTAGYAAALTEAKRYSEAAELLDSITPRHASDEELVKYVRGLLNFRTGRWPDVLIQFPPGAGWRHPELKAAGPRWRPPRWRRWACSRRRPVAPRKPSRGIGCRARPTSRCTPRECASATWAARKRPSSACAGSTRATPSSPRHARRWTTPATGWC